MAATIVGITTMTFGGSAETVAVFTTFSQTSDAQKQTVTDEDGDFIAAAYYSKKSSATMSGFLKGTIPSIGASITLANSITGMSGVTGISCHFVGALMSLSPHFLPNKSRSACRRPTTPSSFAPSGAQRCERL